MRLLSLTHHVLSAVSEDAPIHAAMRTDAMLEAGDLDGYAAWKRILRAVEELQRVEPGARVHWNPGLVAGYSLFFHD